MGIDGSHVKVKVKGSIHVGIDTSVVWKICISKSMKVNKYFKVNMHLEVDILKGWQTKYFPLISNGVHLGWFG
jgi:hypothetical protein